MKIDAFQNQLSDRLIAIDDQLHQLASLENNILNRKPAPDKWSVLECVEHLVRYNDYYLSAIERNTLKRLPARNEINYTWIGRKSIEMMKPTNSKKQKTFARMNPSGSELSPDVFTSLFAQQDRLKALIAGLHRSDYNAKVVKVEFFKLLKMTSAETIEFLMVHEERHLLQMNKLKDILVANKLESTLVI